MVVKLFLSGEFIRFLIVGGVAAVVNFISRIALNTVFSFRWSVVIAYVIGMTTAYILSKYLVFAKSGASPLAEFYRFALVNVFAIVQVWVISVGLAEYIFPKLGYEYYAEEVAHFIGLMIPVISSFLGHKFFTFNRRNHDVAAGPGDNHN